MGHVPIRHWPHLPYQDCHLKPLWKTLAYAQTLQYCAEKANPTLARLTPPFSNEHAWIEVVYEKIYYLHWPWCLWGPSAWVTWSEGWGDHPIKLPVADSPAVLAIALSVLENMSAGPVATPATSKEESVTHVTIPTLSADKSADPPSPSKTTGDAKSPTELEYPRWVKVHSSIQQPL